MGSVTGGFNTGGTIAFNDAIANLGATSVQSAFEAIDERLDAVETSTVTSSINVSFTQADLVNNKIVIAHLLNKPSVVVQVFADNGEKIEPDRINLIDSNNLEIDMTNYVPITGNYQVKIYG